MRQNPLSFKWFLRLHAYHILYYNTGQRLKQFDFRWHCIAETHSFHLFKSLLSTPPISSPWNDKTVLWKARQSLLRSRFSLIANPLCDVCTHPSECGSSGDSYLITRASFVSCWLIDNPVTLPQSPGIYDFHTNS